MPGRDEIEGIGASASLGIDQSIDTLRMDEYDYVEEINFSWMRKKENECISYMNN